MNRQFLSSVKTTLYRKPKEELQRLYRWGPHAYFNIDKWKREMEASAWKLQLLKSSDKALPPPVSVWFLTGKKFWYQTAFCAWTFAKQSGREVILNLVDDGTLLAEHEYELRRLFPEGITLRKDAVRDRIETLLPIDQFPTLRQRWNDYIHIRKLTDIHLDSTGTKLVLDSDMLFFRRPDALLNWWDESQQSVDLNSQPSTSLCLMTDCHESYGYSRELMEELSGAPIPPLLNVGICGLSSDMIDWEQLEYWCRTLLEREGTSYYLEQALVAMLASQSTPVVMPKEDYITFPSRQEIACPSAVLQHYVADSKPGYFGSAWKHTLAQHS